MTRKHFVEIATEFGYVLRQIKDNSHEEVLVFWQTVRAFTHAAKVINPNFSDERFEQFIYEVSVGIRDLEGKKVKAA